MMRMHIGKKGLAASKSAKKTKINEKRPKKAILKLENDVNEVKSIRSSIYRIVFCKDF